MKTFTVSYRMKDLFFFFFFFYSRYTNCGLTFVYLKGSDELLNYIYTKPKLYPKSLKAKTLNLSSQSLNYPQLAVILFGNSPPLSCQVLDQQTPSKKKSLIYKSLTKQLNTGTGKFVINCCREADQSVDTEGKETH